MAMSVYKRSLQDRRTGLLSFFYMDSRNSVMDGAARSNRWLLPAFASSFPTSAATT